MKHPVPKQKQSKSRKAKRYSMFLSLTRKKLMDRTPLVPCKHCSEFKVNHRVCPTCGYLGDRQVIDMRKEVEKITKIKA